MTLVFIAQDKLSVSKTNMRYGKKAPDVSDILPTVRKRGIIQTLLVRPNCQEGHFEIIAGARRYHAALIVASETGEAEPLPCRILAETDDAAAVEASMIENLARLDALGHVSEVSFDERSETLPCLFQAARSAYPKSWRRAAWNKHLRQSRGQIRRQHGCHAGAV
ncbi:ParB/RepB/Spo0J family partition protein [Sphingobium fuliginis]|uniref:Chromosome partitioning protein ParB n=1 Tax=Sphingobium fuliginis (strain ATCC 27551) TaxID=336203 RepID=A0A292Z9P6_SPHSA|nr:chromosome partitioning protein ParB [Sphingobium fuliginis]